MFNLHRSFAVLFYYIMARNDVKRQIASNEYQTKLVNDSNEKIARLIPHVGHGIPVKK